MKKSIISIFIVFALIVTALVTPVIAAESTQTVQIGGKNLTIAQSEKNGMKTVIVSDGNEISTVIYNKKTNKASVVTKNLNGKTILNTTNTVSSSNAVSASTDATPSTQTATATVNDPGYIIYSNQDFWWGYQYAVRKFNYSPTKWWIKTDVASKIVYENSSNISSLQNFMYWVNTMAKDQLACIAAGGTAVASALAGFLSSGTTFGLSAVVGFAIAVGGTFTAGYYAYCAWSDSGTADYYYAISY